MPDSQTCCSSWVRVGAVNPASIVDARLELHHAVQVIVSAAISYLPAHADDSHTSMEWRADHGALVTQPLTPGGLRFGLVVAPLALVRLADGAGPAAFALEGRTMDEAMAWLSGALTAVGLDAARLTSRKHYEIPACPVATGAAWRRRRGHAELAAYVHDGWLVASAVAARDASASPVRCWPHHFDIATLITLPPVPGAGARTIGVGLSPGDNWYAEPYFYVGPRPHPSPHALPPLAQGHWHTAGWTGAVLRASSLAGRETPEAQQAVVTSFVDEAVAACRRAMG